MSWLNAGSLAATNGNANFVGTSTLMLGAYLGDALVYQNGTTFWASEIASITDNTHFATAENWPFSSGTVPNGEWSVLPCSPLRQSVATTNSQLATIIAEFNSVLSLSASDNTCTFNKAANTNSAGMYLTTGGSARGRVGTFGSDDLKLSVANGGGYTDALTVSYTTGLATVAGDPTAALGIATKQYVDGSSNAKVARAATTTNVNISSPGATIGGVTAAANERYLLAGQTTASQNGLYTFNTSTSAMTRCTDADSATELQPGCVVSVAEGTYAGEQFMLTTAAPLVIGTTNLTFTLQTEKPETSVASASTTDIGATNTERVAITGTTTITSFGTRANAKRIVRFSGSLTLTYNATSLITPTGANIQTAAGDMAIVESDSSGNWRIVAYTPAGGIVSSLVSAVSVGNSTATNLTSISLTPGKWRISGGIRYNSGNANNGIRVGISPTSATTLNNFGKDTMDGAISGGPLGGASVPAYDVTITATTTYYLVGVVFSSNAANCDGYIRAERIF